MLARRALLRALAASLALAPLSCTRRARPERRDGRVVVTFWYAYGDLVRKVLLDLVARYNASQTRVVVEAVHQGDYYECLAKLRTALAAGAAPTLSHVVCEVVPYLARAGVLEALDGYEGARALPFVPALAQRGAFAGGERRSPSSPSPSTARRPSPSSTRRMLDEAHVVAAAHLGRARSTPRSALTRRDARTARRAGASRCPSRGGTGSRWSGRPAGALVEPDGRVSLGGEAGEKAIRFWQRLVRDEQRHAAAARARLPGVAVLATRASSRGASR